MIAGARRASGCPLQFMKSTRSATWAVNGMEALQSNRPVTGSKERRRSILKVWDTGFVLSGLPRRASPLSPGAGQRAEGKGAVTLRPSQKAPRFATASVKSWKSTGLTT